MKNKEFIQAIAHIIEMCGNVTADFVENALKIFDFVDVPTEEADQYITLELTLMDEYAAAKQTSGVYYGAKRIRKAMRDCHMI